MGNLAEFTPSACSIIPPMDFVLLLGIMITSLACKGMSSSLPFTTALMSTLISRREPCVGSSRMMTPFDAFALKVMPWASERAWRSVVPSFKVNEPGDLTSPVT